jgi:hypothetical protein
MKNPNSAKVTMTGKENGGLWKWHLEETYKALVPLSIEALKILALANGGACVALLTFCGNLAAKGQMPLLGSFRPAIIWYCLGLASTMLAFISAYGSQLRLYNEEKHRHEVGPPKELHGVLISITGFLAMFAVIKRLAGLDSNGAMQGIRVGAGSLSGGKPAAVRA